LDNAELLTPKEVGKRVKEHRNEIGISMPELGRRVGVNKSTIQRYETDGVNSNRRHDDQRFGGRPANHLRMAYEEGTAKAERGHSQTDKTESLQKFIDKARKITELKELTPELIHKFIDRTIVYAPRYLNGKCVQLMDIYYNGVGTLRERSKAKTA